MTSEASLLREAAAKMREDALRALTDATSPWTATLEDEFGCQIRAANGFEVAGFMPHEGGGVDLDCVEHIASWHPAVTLAVADWLDHTARLTPPDPHHEGEYCETCDNTSRALVVARAYLGRAG